MLHDLCAHGSVIFADAAGKCDRIRTVHDSEVTADGFLDFVCKCIQCELSFFISGLCCIREVTEVAGQIAGQRVNAGFFVENVQHVVRGELLMVTDELYNGRIQVA